MEPKIRPRHTEKVNKTINPIKTEEEISATGKKIELIQTVFNQASR